MAIPQQATLENLSQASAIKIADWLKRCDLSCGNKATEQIGRCEYGQNILDELTVAGIADCPPGRLSIGLPKPAFSGNPSTPKSVLVSHQTATRKINLRCQFTTQQENGYLRQLV